MDKSALKLRVVATATEDSSEALYPVYAQLKVSFVHPCHKNKLVLNDAYA